MYICTYVSNVNFPMKFFKTQIRLNFDTFNIAQPSTNRPEDNNPNGRTQCQVCVKVRKTDLKKICLRTEVHDCAWFSHLRRPFLQKAQFSANSAGPSAPVICGTNTGYHMILEVGSSQNLESSFNVITNKILGAGWLQHIIFHMDFSFPSKLEHSNYAGGHFHLHIHSGFVISILTCDFIWACISLVLICKHIYILHIFYWLLCILNVNMSIFLLFVQLWFQISCTAAWRPTAGCLQWFTGAFQTQSHIFNPF